MTEPERPRSVVRVGAVVVVAAGAATSWLLMMRGALDALYFEPTTEAVIRAEHARSQTVPAAAGVVLLALGLALLLRRWAVLPLAGPGLAVGLLTVALPQAAAFAFGAALTGLALCASGLMFGIAHRERHKAGLSGLSKRRRPLAVVAAAVLAGCYALVLTGLAVIIGFEQLSGTGQLGAEHLDGLALRGVVSFVVALLIGAVTLLVGARRLYETGARRLVLIPLLIVLVIGTVGEIADLLGTATQRSDVIGLAILVLAGMPVVLVFTRAGRAWRHHRTGAELEANP